MIAVVGFTRRTEQLASSERGSRRCSIAGRKATERAAFLGSRSRVIRPYSVVERMPAWGRLGPAIRPQEPHDMTVRVP
jgi:hypothetical protein